MIHDVLRHTAHCADLYASSARDLPELTQGFKREGMNLSSLYPRLLIPLEWVGRDIVRQRIERGTSGGGLWRLRS